MKQLSLAVTVLFCFFKSSAQFSSTYQKDVDKLYNVLQKTYSYKDQIRGHKKEAFDALYNYLKNDTAEAGDTFQRYYKLAKLIFLIRDNHLGFFQYPPLVLGKEQYDTLTYVERYRNSSFFKNYPKVAFNLDSMEQQLKNRNKDSAEGIYYYGSLLKVGLYRTPATNEFTGVVLQTSLPVWDKGQIAIKLYEYQPGYFNAVYGHPQTKNLLLYANEKVRNGTLVNSFFYTQLTEQIYRKDTSAKDYAIIPRSAPDFVLKSINPQTQYLRLGNFSAMRVAMQESDSFYLAIKDALHAENLLVDLRDNTGGAKKVSEKFYRLIKQFAKNKRVHVLVNNGTMSRGEIFTIQLMALLNVKVYGQTTKGTIAYGTNYGTVEKLPSGHYGVSITDMDDKEGYVKYESYGIEPHVVLQNDGDWIEKVLQLISGGK